MKIRTWLVGRRSRMLRAVALGAALVLVAACSQLPGPDPAPSTTAPLVPPPTEFAPLAVDATSGLGTGANDFDTGLAAAGNLVVAAGIVYGDRLAPAFRYSTDTGATWQLGRLSEEADRDTPPDQGDQTDDIAVSTVDGVTNWVVLGQSWRQPLTWTSTDGKTWDRHALPADQIAEESDVRAIAAVPEGFVLVGADTLDNPTAWTSADGVSWQPHRMGGQGVPVAVTSKGATVVAVGWHDDAYATWTSLDRGRTWRRGTPPKAPSDDNDFSRSLADVTATEDGFAAIGSYQADDWRPVVYRSWNGRSWGQAPAPTSSKGDTDGSLVRAAAGEEVAVTQEYVSQGHPRLWTRRGERWREAKTPLSDRSRLDEGEWILGDLVRSGDVWIASALLSRNGQVVAEIWRSTDGGQTFTAAPRPDAELNQPVANQGWVVRRGDETLVFGDSRRRPVVWRRTGAEAFGPAQLVSADARDRVEGAVAGPEGVLAYGIRIADSAEAAVIWRRIGTRWVATEPGTFSTADRRYASSSISQIAWLRGRWVAVGQTTDNGDLNNSALVATSSDGRTWTKGRAARIFTKAGGDVWYDVTDLQGNHDRERDMNGIAAVGRRLIAVGDSAEGDSDSGTGTAATVWFSDDARTWTIRRLPLAGLSWSSMDQVAVRGSSVVVVGTGATSKGAPTRQVVWHSPDGGRTWTQQVLDAALQTQNAVTSLVALRSRFALITEKAEGTSRPVLLLSEDGVSWRDHPLSAVSQQPGEGSVAPGAVADGDDLWLLVRTTNRAGAGGRLIVQPTN